MEAEKARIDAAALKVCLIYPWDPETRETPTSKDTLTQSHKHTRTQAEALKMKAEAEAVAEILTSPSTKNA